MTDCGNNPVVVKKTITRTHKCCIHNQSENCGEIIDIEACCVLNSPSQTGLFPDDFCSGQCGVGDPKNPDMGPCCGNTRITQSVQKCCPGDVVKGINEQCPGVTGDPHVSPFCGDSYDL